jgi:molybdopterin-guanine dinucleotide biosynthesis protein A
MGICSCLKASSNDLCFITACDIPEIKTGYILKMLEMAPESDIVVPVSDSSGYEPMYALYRKSVIAPAWELLQSGKLKISPLFDMVVTKYIPFDGDGWYHNLNYRNDYQEFSRKVGLPDK